MVNSAITAMFRPEFCPVVLFSVFAGLAYVMLLTAVLFSGLCYMFVAIMRHHKEIYRRCALLVGRHIFVARNRSLLQKRIISLYTVQR